MKNRNDIGKLSGIVGIGANLFLTLIKLIVGIISSSVAIIADALNNLSDTASSVITLIGFKLASQPADKDHPYGHARAEYLSGLAVSVVIIVIGFELAKTSIAKIINPAETRFSIWLVLVLVISIIVKLFLYFFYITLNTSQVSNRKKEVQIFKNLVSSFYFHMSLLFHLSLWTFAFAFSPNIVTNKNQ